MSAMPTANFVSGGRDGATDRSDLYRPLPDLAKPTDSRRAQKDPDLSGGFRHLDV